MKYLDLLDCCALMALRMSLALPLPALQAILPAALPALGATLAPIFAPALAPLVFLLAIRYLHPGKVSFPKHGDTPMGPAGNSPDSYLVLNLLTTPSTPATVLTTSSTSSLSAGLSTVPCSVATNEHELTFMPDVPFHRLPRAPRASWARCASLAGRSAFEPTEDGLTIPAQP